MSATALSVSNFVALRPSLAEKRHSLVVTVKSDSAVLELVGEFDLVSSAQSWQAFAPLISLPLPLLVDAAAVRFIDSYGLAPLLELAECRRDSHRPPVSVVAQSPSFRRLLAVLDPSSQMLPVCPPNRG